MTEPWVLFAQLWLAAQAGDPGAQAVVATWPPETADGAAQWAERLP